MYPKELFFRFCNSIQSAYISYSTMLYLQEQNREKWREFEQEIETDYNLQESIRTFNLYFTPEVLSKNGDKSFLRNCMISSMDITDTLVDDDLSLSGLYFLYCFSRLECFGYDLLKIKVPNTTKEEYNWHKCVYADAKLDHFQKFQKIWQLSATEINQDVLLIFAKLKERRHAFARESDSEDRKLIYDLQDILLVGYYFYYLVTNDSDELTIKSFEENYEM